MKKGRAHAASVFRIKSMRALPASDYVAALELVRRTARDVGEFFTRFLARSLGVSVGGKFRFRVRQKSRFVIAGSI